MSKKLKIGLLIASCLCVVAFGIWVSYSVFSKGANTFSDEAVQQIELSVTSQSKFIHLKTDEFGKEVAFDTYSGIMYHYETEGNSYTPLYDKDGTLRNFWTEKGLDTTDKKVEFLKEEYSDYFWGY